MNRDKCGYSHLVPNTSIDGGKGMVLKKLKFRIVLMRFASLHFISTISKANSAKFNKIRHLGDRQYRIKYC